MDYKDSDSDPLAVLKYGDEKSDIVAEEQNKESEIVNGTDTQQPWHQMESIVIRAIIPKLKTFHQLLQEPPPKPSFFSKSLSDPPLGNTRLRVSALIASLIVLNNQEFISELIELNIFQTLLDLFCRYPWNNFYHTQFETCITYALKPVSTRKNEDNPLMKHLFVDCELMQFVLKLWENNKISMECENGRRQGYMGHLIEIASVINSTVKENSAVEPLLNEHFPDVLTQWNQLVDDELNPTLECQKECLSGIHPRDAQPEDEVTTSDKFSGKKFSEYRTESCWENDANMDENVNNDVDEALFQDLCAQKSNNWNNDALPFDENDEDENENGDDDDDDIIDNEEEIEEGNSEGNSSSNSERKQSPLKSRVFQSRRKDRYRNSNFQPQDDKGMDSKIFINENAPFIADTDKIHFDVAFSSVSFSPWKQTFDDNANTGWADFEANFGSPTASQFNSVAFSDPESKNKIETETSNFNGPKNDPFAVGQIVTNSCSFQQESFLNDNDFGSFESATSFEISDPFKDKDTLNFYRICDKKAFDSIDKNEKLESNIDKTFETFDFNVEKASGIPECTADEAFKTPEPNVEATRLTESNLDKASESPESDLEKGSMNEATGLFESSGEKIEEASESNIDKTFEFSESNKDKLLNNLESSIDKDSDTPEFNPDEAFETPNSSLDRAFETPDSSLDELCEAADSTMDESFEKVALHDKMCALELSQNSDVGATPELKPDIPTISEANPKSKVDIPAGIESKSDDSPETTAAAEESNKIVINDTGKGDECLDKVTVAEKCVDLNVVALESPSTREEEL